MKTKCSGVRSFTFGISLSSVYDLKPRELTDLQRDFVLKVLVLGYLYIMLYYKRREHSERLEGKMRRNVFFKFLVNQNWHVSALIKKIISTKDSCFSTTCTCFTAQKE